MPGNASGPDWVWFAGLGTLVILFLARLLVKVIEKASDLQDTNQRQFRESVLADLNELKIGQRDEVRARTEADNELRSQITNLRLIVNNPK